MLVTFVGVGVDGGAGVTVVSPQSPPISPIVTVSGIVEMAIFTSENTAVAIANSRRPLRYLLTSNPKLKHNTYVKIVEVV
jgi:hypothetical protein